MLQPEKMRIEARAPLEPVVPVNLEHAGEVVVAFSHPGDFVEKDHGPARGRNRVGKHLERLEPGIGDRVDRVRQDPIGMSRKIWA